MRGYGRLHAPVEGEGELEQVVPVELVDRARRDGGHARRRLLLVREIAVRVSAELVAPPVGAAPARRGEEALARVGTARLRGFGAQRPSGGGGAEAGARAESGEGEGEGVVAMRTTRSSSAPAAAGASARAAAPTRPYRSVE